MLSGRFYKSIIICLLLVSVSYQYETMFRLPFHSEIKFDREIVKNPIRIYLQIFRWLFSLTGKGHDLYADSPNANLNINAAIQREKAILTGSTATPARVALTRSQPSSLKLYFGTTAVPIQPVYLSATEYGQPTSVFATQVKVLLIPARPVLYPGQNKFGQSDYKLHFDYCNCWFQLDLQPGLVEQPFCGTIIQQRDRW